MPRRRGGNDFTESDDDHLIKFIAQVKPDNSGRLGNTLYLFLEESTSQRPWAKRHSWQSWRERYKRRQIWFDHRIKRYQKKLRENASASDIEDLEKLQAELSGAAQTPEEGRDDDVCESARPSSSKDNIYPSIENIPQPGTVTKETVIASGGKPSPSDAPQPTQHHHTKLKRISLPRDDDSNFFCTPPPSPSPPADNSTAKGKLPILIDGPYRNSLKRTPTSLGNVTNDGSPKRRKTTSEDIDMLDSRGRAETKEAIAVTPYPVGRADGSLQLFRPAQGVSFETPLPDLPRRLVKPTNLLKVIYAKDTPSFDTEAKTPLPDPPHRHVKPYNPLKAKEPPSFDTKIAIDASNFLFTDEAYSPQAMRDAKPIVDYKKMDDEGVRGSRSQNSVPNNKYMHRLTASPNDGVAARLFAHRPSPDIDDPFTANNLPDIPPRRIDLRDSLNASRRSCNISSRTSPTRSSTSRHSISSPFLPEDQDIVNQAGFSKIMAVIAKHYGFDVDVAMKTFFATKSIEKTKSVLQLGQAVAKSATSAFLAELGNHDDIDSSGDEPHQSMSRGRSSPSRKDGRALNSEGQKILKRSLGPRKATRPSLNIKLQPLDDDVDQISLSDYSPPCFSRAGQFKRLVKQGRREEAVDRERRRASGTFVAQSQTQESNLKL